MREDPLHLIHMLLHEKYDLNSTRSLYFLIFFGVGTVGYLGGGFAYNTKQRGLSGSEAIPNIEAWEQLPDLVKDGFYFTYERIEGLRTGKDGYEEIRHRRDSEHGGPPTDSL